MRAHDPSPYVAAHLNALGAHIPAPLRDVIEKCLAVLPAQRPTLSAVRREIQSALTDWERAVQWAASAQRSADNKSAPASAAAASSTTTTPSTAGLSTALLAAVSQIPRWPAECHLRSAMWDGDLARVQQILNGGAAAADSSASSSSASPSSPSSAAATAAPARSALNLNSRDGGGRTPLLLLTSRIASQAIRQHSVALFRMLVSAGAAVNARVEVRINVLCEYLVPPACF
jgi:hypothetical protein